MATTNPTLYDPRIYGKSEYSTNPDPETLSLSLSDSATSTDSRVVDAIAQVLADSIGSTDSRVVAAIAQVISDSITDIDDIMKLALNPLDDSVSSSDAKIISATKALTEALSNSDGVIISAQKAVADSLTALDAKAIAAIKILADSISATETRPRMHITIQPTDFLIVKEWIAIKLTHSVSWQIGGPSRTVRPHFYGNVLYAQNMYSTNIALLWVAGARNSGPTFTAIDGHKYNS